MKFRNKKKTNKQQSVDLLTQLDQIASASSSDYDSGKQCTAGLEPPDEEDDGVAAAIIAGITNNLNAMVDSDGESAADIFDDDDEDDRDEIENAAKNKGNSSSLGAASRNASGHTGKSPSSTHSYKGGGNPFFPGAVKPDPDGHNADGSKASSTHREEPDDDDELSHSSADTVSDVDDGKSDDSESAEDYTDDEDEGADGYRPGGYHPVKTGEVYNQR